VADQAKAGAFKGVGNEAVSMGDWQAFADALLIKKD
jgi:hypothetical protein